MEGEDAQTSRLPVAFLERMRELLDEETLARVLASFRAPRAASLRVNRLRAEPGEVRKELAGEGFELEPVELLPDAFVLVAGAKRALQETDAYRRGAIYLQGLSSMLAPLLLDPRPGERVLDLCAAPGSKTSQLAAMMGSEGELVANDRSRKRCYKLERVLADQGADFVTLTNLRGERYGRTHPGHFDRVLVDAPCSSEGRFHEDEPASHADWKPSKVKRLASEQRRLLISGLRALRPGGRLVYSTCTFAPEENERVVDKVLRYLGRAFRLSPPPFEVPSAVPGLVEWRGRSLAPELVRTRRILPSPGFEGFFLAVFEASSDLSGEPPEGGDPEGGDV